MSASFRIVLRGAQSDAGDAVAAIGRFAAGAGLPAALQNDLAVIVDEVVSNWLGHGGAAGVPTSEMQIEFSLDANRLRLRFSDNAPPFDPLAAAPPDFSIPPDRRPIGGLGLHLLRALTDSQRYARVDGRNLLELERSIPGELG